MILSFKHILLYTIYDNPETLINLVVKKLSRIKKSQNNVLTYFNFFTYSTISLICFLSTKLVGSVKPFKISCSS